MFGPRAEPLSAGAAATYRTDISAPSWEYLGLLLALRRLFRVAQMGAVQRPTRLGAAGLTQGIKNHGLLLVDTDVAFRDELSVALERFDVAIVWRARVKGLLEAVADTKPLAVVLSADLPGSDPVELLRTIRDHAGASDLAVYVVGSALTRETVLRAYVEGADAVLIRDAAVAEIAARVLGRVKGARASRRVDGRSVADAALDLCDGPPTPAAAAHVAQVRAAPPELAPVPEAPQPEAPQPPLAPPPANDNPFVFTNEPGSSDAIAYAVAAAAHAAGIAQTDSPVLAQQDMPVQPAPIQPMPMQPAPMQPMPIQPMPMQPAPTQPAPMQPAPVQPMTMQPAPLQPAPMQPMPMQPMPAFTNPTSLGVPIGVSPPAPARADGGAGAGFGVRPATSVAVPDVIIVEDDPSLLEMLRYALTNRGYQTLSFSNGLDALRALREMDTAGQKPVVLLDVDLPGIDGFRILHELAGSRPGIYQIIMCTIHNSEATQVLGIQSGALDYLVKPLRMPIVLAKVEALIGHGSFNAAARGR